MNMWARSTCLCESEDVVDEQEDVLALLIPEILCHRQARQCDTRTSTWRFIHLTKYESRFAIPINFDHSRGFHLMIQIISLPRPLPHLHIV